MVDAGIMNKDRMLRPFILRRFSDRFSFLGVAVAGPLIGEVIACGYCSALRCRGPGRLVQGLGACDSKPAAPFPAFPGGRGACVSVAWRPWPGGLRA